jgi:cell division septal protein FtsQ
MKLRYITISVVLPVIACSACLLLGKHALEVSRKYFPINQIQVFGNLHFTAHRKIEESIAVSVESGFFLVNFKYNFTNFSMT